MLEHPLFLDNDDLPEKRCIVMAHPDDETLWCGGLPLMFPGEWTIICCSVPRADPIRAWKFFDACRRLGATGRLMPRLETAWGDELPINDYMDWNEFDLWITHGSDGEYGHPHHISVHKQVSDCAGGEVWFHETTATARFYFDLGKRDVAEKKYDALRAYDHHHPYAPLGMCRKWEALLHRYQGTNPLGVEKYNVR